MAPLVFRNFARVYQLRIESAEDFEAVLQLADARWAATSAPVSAFDTDAAFLTFLDTDANGRIRSDEVREAIRWLLHHLAGREHVADGADTLHLHDIDTSHEDGRRLHASATQILDNLAVADTDSISLAQVRNRKAIMAAAHSNGDGVIPPAAAPDAESRALVEAVMAAVGSAPDASGATGVNTDLLDRFLDEARARLAWEAEGHPADDAAQQALRPWGEDTAPAWALIAGIDDAVELFFTQCDTVRQDPRALERLRWNDDDLAALRNADRAGLEERLRDAPLAPPNPEGVLDLDGPLNPVHEEQLLLLRDRVVRRALAVAAGDEPPPLTRLTRSSWRTITSIFAPYRAWLEEERGRAVAGFDRERLQAWLDGPVPDELRRLIDADRAVADEFTRTRDVEKLILYQQNLLEFANSFVSFPRLYDPDRRSLFEVGTLVLDGREMTFAVRVADRAAHRRFAESSGMCVLYIEVTGRNEPPERFEAVAAVTSGDSIGLVPEKRGVFFTPDGREWDARIVDIILNPVSLWEAFKAPFRRAGEYVMQQIEKFGKAQQARIESAVGAPSTTGATRDLLLAGSVGLAALGSAFAYVTKTLAAVHPRDVLLVVGGILVVILGPTFLVGYLKLRRRDLTTLLEASGWAVNLRIRVTWHLGRLFTTRPGLPAGSQRERRDLVEMFSRRLGMRRAGNWRRLLPVALAIVALCFAAPLLPAGAREFLMKCLGKLWSLVGR